MMGPLAIDLGRDRYNSIIQSTSKVQTLSNVVRVFNHEPMSVMEVTEVDAAQSIGGGVNGGLSGIGAQAGTKSTSAGTIAGQVGSVSGNAQYSEIPTIRYQPLLGQSLVAQLVTPVSADALGLLYDSSWDVSPLLDLASAYLTLDYSEFHAALNIIAELHSDGALELVAGKSELSNAPQGPAKSKPAGQGAPGTITLEVASKPAGNGPNDVLDIYLQPSHRHDLRAGLDDEKRQLQLWSRLLWLYNGTQPKFTPKNPARCAQIGVSANSSGLRKFDRSLKTDRRINLDEVRNCLPNFIELRTASLPHERVRNEGLISGAPLMRTYSALGILKNATERPHPKIAFVSRDTYDKIRAYPWNQETDLSSFYTLLPETEDPLDNPSNGNEAARIEQNVTDWIRGPGNDLFVYDPASKISDEDYIKGNRRLGLLRRYILIVVDDLPPVNAYVAHESQGKWYYIDRDDAISQKNFDLISLFLTMMAIPSAVPPLSPTINVGGM